MVEYFGNCNHLFDWNAIIADLEKQTPHKVGPAKHNIEPSFHKAGLKRADEGGTLAFDLYNCGINFDPEIAERFAHFVGREGSYTVAWISRIRPGYTTGWHYDKYTVDSQAMAADRKRFHCQMSPPSDGHVLMIGKQALYNVPQGDVYVWGAQDSHAGHNAGLVNKYTFHLA